MTQGDGKGGDVYMNTFVDLCEPESRDLKKPEVPEMLLPVGESDLLFWGPIKILSSRMTWESVFGLHIAI